MSRVKLDNCIEQLRARIANTEDSIKEGLGEGFQGDVIGFIQTCRLRRDRDFLEEAIKLANDFEYTVWSSTRDNLMITDLFYFK